MAQPVAREGDSLDHGGVIIEGSDTKLANGKRVARVGDKAMCAQHGIVTIVDGNANWPVDGRAIARVGSKCSCGATILTGSPNVYSNR